MDLLARGAVEKRRCGGTLGRGTEAYEVDEMEIDGRVGLPGASHFSWSVVGSSVLGVRVVVGVERVHACGALLTPFVVATIG